MEYHIGSFKEDGKILRKCRICREIKELNEENFIRRSSENGWRGRCRLCYNKNSRIKQELSKNEVIVSKRYRDKYKKIQPLELLYRTCKGNAKKYNNREFTIIPEDLHNQWLNQNGKCYYTNRDMKFELGFKDSVSIDRFDSSKGYTKDNIVLCQRQVNIMKNDATLNELISFATDIINKFKIK
jgi:hypothetical protein